MNGILVAALRAHGLDPAIYRPGGATVAGRSAATVIIARYQRR